MSDEDICDSKKAEDILLTSIIDVPKNKNKTSTSDPDVPKNKNKTSTSDPGVPKNKNKTPATDPDVPKNMNKTSATDPDVPTNMNKTSTSDPDVPKNKNKTSATDPDVPTNKNKTSTSDPDVPKNKNKTPATDPGVPKNKNKTPATDSDVPLSPVQSPSNIDETVSPNGVSNDDETRVTENNVRDMQPPRAQSFFSRVREFEQNHTQLWLSNVLFWEIFQLGLSIAGVVLYFLGWNENDINKVLCVLSIIGIIAAIVKFWYYMVRRQETLGNQRDNREGEDE